MLEKLSDQVLTEAPGSKGFRARTPRLPSCCCQSKSESLNITDWIPVLPGGHSQP